MDGHTLYLGSCGQLDHIGLNIMTWILSLIKKHSSWAFISLAINMLLNIEISFSEVALGLKSRLKGITTLVNI